MEVRLLMLLMTVFVLRRLTEKVISKNKKLFVHIC